MSTKNSKTNEDSLARQKPAPTSRRRQKADPTDSSDDKLGTMFQTLVKNVFGVIMVTATDGTVQYVTPSVKRVLGYDPVDLFGNKAFEYVHPDDLQQSKKIAKAVSSDGAGSEPLDVRMRHWDGSYRICQTVIQKISNGLAFSYHDVTEQRKAEKALRRSEERYRKAFRCSPDSITISEMVTGRFIEVNEGFVRMTGHTHDEVIGKTSLDIGLWRDAEDRARVVKTLKRDGSARDIEADFVTKDGDVLHCLVSSEWFELDNQRCLVMIARDITERKQYEERLQRTGRELERERHELTEKNIALKQILDHIEQEKSEFRKEISARIETLLKPMIAKLKSSGGHLQNKDVVQLESSINSIVGADVDRFKENLTKLTPRELDICDLIKKGFSSKEIAAYLNVSVQTVHKHRQLIRRKLQLNNQDVNLAAYLRLR
jgi:PAS domain S-box-containing protein